MKTTKSPFFSIIIPTFNRDKFISKAIDNVLNQTFDNWELIIIDDGSTDNTRTIVSNYSDARINYFYQKNQERSAARNHGIKVSKGEWVCFLDSDDIYLPNHLEVFFKKIEINSSARMMVNQIEIFKSSNCKIHPKLNHEAPNLIEEVAQKFILINTVCIHQNILKENRFNEKYSIWEDTHLWLRVLSKYELQQNLVVTSRQYIHDETSVTKIFELVIFSTVKQYIDAIDDLFHPVKGELKKCISEKFYKNYKTSKYKMFLYQARQNKQLVTAFKLWVCTVQNDLTLQNILILPKIFLNKLNIGIHK